MTTTKEFPPTVAIAIDEDDLLALERPEDHAQLYEEVEVGVYTLTTVMIVSAKPSTKPK